MIRLVSVVRPVPEPRDPFSPVFIKDDTPRTLLVMNPIFALLSLPTVKSLLGREKSKPAIAAPAL
jgi:hypothetical protein